MTYGNDTVTLRDHFERINLKKEELKNQVSELKKDFEEYITNPVHTLELRWQMFLDAPDELSNIDDSIYHGLNFVKMKNSEYDTWFRHKFEDYNRGCEISLTEIYEDIEGVYTSIKDGTAPEYIRKNYEDAIFTKDPDMLTKIKEQLLKDNIKSFVFDW